MEKYTFITEYRGGTYISQYKASSLIEVLRLWANNLDKKIFTLNKKEKILFEIENPDFFPMPISGIDNVWCGAYLSGSFFLLVNIIKTV
ncbi:MAG: hypothetical protein LBQ60_08040 [Bacteroidales bacterium]|jgi:hypothetical protein|nr:hypothetical protein [Bacteroidales bacterium]